MAKKYEVGLVVSVWFNINIEANSLSEAADIAADVAKNYSIKKLKRDLKNENRANDWQTHVAGVFDNDALGRM